MVVLFIVMLGFLGCNIGKSPFLMEHIYPSPNPLKLRTKKTVFFKLELPFSTSPQQRHHFIFLTRSQPTECFFLVHPTYGHLGLTFIYASSLKLFKTPTHLLDISRSIQHDSTS